MYIFTSVVVFFTAVRQLALFSNALPQIFEAHHRSRRCLYSPKISAPFIMQEHRRSPTMAGQFAVSFIIQITILCFGCPVHC
jgi:hypothetical protein